MNTRWIQLLLQVSACLEIFGSGLTWTNIAHAAPTLTTVSIAADNANTSQAKVGDEITVSIISDQVLVTHPTVTIAGQAAVVAGSGTSFTAKLTVAAGVTPNGLAAIDISGYANAAVEVGIIVTSVTDGSSVNVDGGAPALNTVSIGSNNANTSQAKVGDEITVSIISNEVLITLPTAMIAGQAAVVTGSGTGFAARLTVTGATPTGLTSINISGFADAAGNVGTTLTSVTDGSSVNVDDAAPIITTVSIASNNVNTSQAKQATRLRFRSLLMRLLVHHLR